MLSWYYHEVMGMIDENEEKKYLMVDDYELSKILDKLKEIISIEHFHNTKILIDTDVKLPDITLKTVMILMTCVIKDDDKFYLQLFLGEALLEA